MEKHIDTFVWDGWIKSDRVHVDIQIGDGFKQAMKKVKVSSDLLSKIRCIDCTNLAVIQNIPSDAIVIVDRDDKYDNVFKRLLYGRVFMYKSLKSAHFRFDRWNGQSLRNNDLKGCSIWSDITIPREESLKIHEANGQIVSGWPMEADYVILDENTKKEERWKIILAYIHGAKPKTRSWLKGSRIRLSGHDQKKLFIGFRVYINELIDPKIAVKLGPLFRDHGAVVIREREPWCIELVPNRDDKKESHDYTDAMRLEFCRLRVAPVGFEWMHGMLTDGLDSKVDICKAFPAVIRSREPFIFHSGSEVFNQRICLIGDETKLNERFMKVIKANGNKFVNEHEWLWADNVIVIASTQFPVDRNTISVFHANLWAETNFNATLKDYDTLTIPLVLQKNSRACAGYLWRFVTEDRNYIAKSGAHAVMSMGGILVLDEDELDTRQNRLKKPIYIAVTRRTDIVKHLLDNDRLVCLPSLVYNCGVNGMPKEIPAQHKLTLDNLGDMLEEKVDSAILSRQVGYDVEIETLKYAQRSSPQQRKPLPIKSTRINYRKRKTKRTDFNNRETIIKRRRGDDTVDVDCGNMSLVPHYHSPTSTTSLSLPTTSFISKNKSQFSFDLDNDETSKVTPAVLYKHVFETSVMDAVVDDANMQCYFVAGAPTGIEKRLGPIKRTSFLQDVIQDPVQIENEHLETAMLVESTDEYSNFATFTDESTPKCDKADISDEIRNCADNVAASLPTIVNQLGQDENIENPSILNCAEEYPNHGKEDHMKSLSALPTTCYNDHSMSASDSSNKEEENHAKLTSSIGEGDDAKDIHKEIMTETESVEEQQCKLKANSEMQDCQSSVNHQSAVITPINGNEVNMEGVSTLPTTSYNDPSMPNCDSLKKEEESHTKAINCIDECDDASKDIRREIITETDSVEEQQCKLKANSEMQDCQSSVNHQSAVITPINGNEVNMEGVSTLPTTNCNDPSNANCDSLEKEEESHTKAINCIEESDDAKDITRPDYQSSFDKHADSKESVLPSPITQLVHPIVESCAESLNRMENLSANLDIPNIPKCGYHDKIQTKIIQNEMDSIQIEDEGTSVAVGPNQHGASVGEYHEANMDHCTMLNKAETSSKLENMAESVSSLATNCEDVSTLAGNSNEKTHDQMETSEKHGMLVASTQQCPREALSDIDNVDVSDNDNIHEIGHGRTATVVDSMQKYRKGNPNTCQMNLNQPVDSPESSIPSEMVNSTEKSPAVQVSRSADKKDEICYSSFQDASHSKSVQVDGQDVIPCDNATIQVINKENQRDRSKLEFVGPSSGISFAKPRIHAERSNNNPASSFNMPNSVIPRNAVAPSFVGAHQNQQAQGIHLDEQHLCKVFLDKIVSLGNKISFNMKNTLGCDVSCRRISQRDVSKLLSRGNFDSTTVQKGGIFICNVANLNEKVFVACLPGDIAALVSTTKTIFSDFLHECGMRPCVSGNDAIRFVVRYNKVDNIIAAGIDKLPTHSFAWINSRVFCAIRIMENMPFEFYRTTHVKYCIHSEGADDYNCVQCKPIGKILENGHPNCTTAAIRLECKGSGEVLMKTVGPYPVAKLEVNENLVTTATMIRESHFEKTPVFPTFICGDCIRKCNHPSQWVKVDPSLEGYRCDYCYTLSPNRVTYIKILTSF